MSMSPPRKVVVVGAGPVGCLAALSFAKMGWEVEIYEGRPDMRLPSSKAAAQQRSINLAISSRGITALRVIKPSAADRLLQTAIPMKGRMIHDERGKSHSQLYDSRDGQCINSIDRALLNEGLLEEVSVSTKIRVFFRYRLQSVDFEGRVASVRDMEQNRDVNIRFDFLVGADGSYSVVRHQLMRIIRRMDYHQEYIPHDYIELKMPSGRDRKGKEMFLLDQNHLHIWPRHAFMLIALPNKDKSFTCTLFAPTAEFESLRSREAILNWFGRYFPDAVSLIGGTKLIEDFERNPRSPLISVKANPYHYKDRAVILGDAAHAMVPFFGQGLNCGLEDVRVLDTLLRSASVTAGPPEAGPKLGSGIDQRLANALDLYSATRHEDLVAICNLAMDNYIEMRHSVITPTYLLKKAIDDVLYSLNWERQEATNHVSLLSEVPFRIGEPSGWLPLYTMVTFRPDIGYAAARKKALKQARIMRRVGWLGTAILGAASAGIIFLTISHRRKYLC